MFIKAINQVRCFWGEGRVAVAAPLTVLKTTTTKQQKKNTVMKASPFLDAFVCFFS